MVDDAMEVGLRTIFASYGWSEVLRLQVERKTETLNRNWAEMPPSMFCAEVGTPLDESRVRTATRVFKQACISTRGAALRPAARRAPIEGGRHARSDRRLPALHDDRRPSGLAAGGQVQLHGLSVVKGQGVQGRESLDRHPLYG